METYTVDFQWVEILSLCKTQEILVGFDLLVPPCLEEKNSVVLNDELGASVSLWQSAYLSGRPTVSLVTAQD